MRRRVVLSRLSLFLLAMRASRGLEEEEEEGEEEDEEEEEVEVVVMEKTRGRGLGGRALGEGLNEGGVGRLCWGGGWVQGLLCLGAALMLHNTADCRSMPLSPATSAQGGVTRRGVVLTYRLSLVIGSQ